MLCFIIMESYASERRGVSNGFNYSIKVQAVFWIKEKKWNT